MDEQWVNLPIPGFPDYQVSNFGQVRSLPRTVRYSNGGVRDLVGKILKPIKGNNGYYCYSLWFGRKIKRVTGHRLVALAFIPNPDNLPQVNHKDFNKANNREENLEWVTAKQNTEHANKAKRCKRPYGENHASTRITDAEIQQIRGLRNKGMTQQALADMFNCSQCHVSDILNFKKRAYMLPK